MSFQGAACSSNRSLFDTSSVASISLISDPCPRFARMFFPPEPWMTKVLVLESDNAFASELVNELEKLDCDVRVIDDGNVGLQMAAADPPDLILLSIELPRMNGFSVCNKLKKDPSLKAVPLIIMSSESSDETFEQHRRLRTRAEDYVHKPVAFSDLLEHIRRFVRIGSQSDIMSVDNAIIIDDEIVFEEERDDETRTEMMDRPGIDLASTYEQPLADDPHRAAVSVDLDVDQFADAAFDRLLGKGRRRGMRKARPHHPRRRPGLKRRRYLRPSRRPPRTSRPPPRPSPRRGPSPLRPQRSPPRPAWRSHPCDRAAGGSKTRGRTACSARAVTARS